MIDANTGKVIKAAITKVEVTDHISDIEKEDAFPTLSDTYLDVQHLLEVLNVFIRQNIR